MARNQPGQTTLRRWIKWGAIAALAAFVVAWGVGEAIYPRTNPPQRYTGVILSPASDTILRGACFDCHSNETVHPWYRHLPLGALIIGDDILDGRAHMNFSDWGELSQAKRSKLIREAMREVHEGDMPPIQYRLLHPKARLTPTQINQLAADALSRYGVKGPSGDSEDSD